MKVRNNIPVYKISWLRYADGGTIGTYYEPENREELLNLCKHLYKEGKEFEIVGHTSNIYFLPSYSVDILVSTRKVKETTEEDKYIIADCGVSVSTLAKKMVEQGIKGFEGLIDLPGTVAASVYGNASCYGCSINTLMTSCTLLQPNGEVLTIRPQDLRLQKRSSALKRKELKGVILTVTLKKEKGDAEQLATQAEQNHLKRKVTQPGPNDNLGSIYAVSDGWSLYSVIPRMITAIYGLLIGLTDKDKESLKLRKKAFMFRLLGAKDLLPYVFGWNRYIWKDARSHELFWKFHRLHQKMFKKSVFEIEIKGKR